MLSAMPYTSQSPTSRVERLKQYALDGNQTVTHLKKLVDEVNADNRNGLNRMVTSSQSAKLLLILQAKQSKMWASI